MATDSGERLLNDQEIEELLNASNESLLCLKQVLISRSSLLRHPLYHFPPLTDPGLDECFDYIEPLPDYDYTGSESYKDKCKYFNIAPASRIIQDLRTATKLDLTFYGLSFAQVKALCEAMKMNRSITELNLEDNRMTPEALSELSDMLITNKTLQKLSLKRCKLREEGIVFLNDGIGGNDVLIELDLSFNDIGDRGFSLIETGLTDNLAVKVLNLSRNKLGSDSSDSMSEFIGSNDTVEELDLSWNHFNSIAGNKILAAGLVNNVSLKSLSLSWNGIVESGALKPLVNFIKATETLQHLDMSHNGMTGPLGDLLRRAIGRCEPLQTLNLSGNPLRPDDALGFARLLLATGRNLKFIDMKHVYVERDFLPIMKRIENLGRNVVIGGIIGDYTVKGPDVANVLFRRAKFLAASGKGKAKKDFGHFVLQLPDTKWSKQEFLDAVKKFKMKKVDADLVNGIAERFTIVKGKGKGKIDLLPMKEAYVTYYPDTCLPPVKTKGKKRTPAPNEE